MSTKIRNGVLLILLMSGLAGCNTMGRNETTGTVVGAAAGAGVGYAVAGTGTGAVVGAVAGGVVGNRIGANQDRRDYRRY